MNSHGQSMPCPPFGSFEYLLRTPLYLKQGYKLLEMFSLCPLYSIRTATRQPHCTPLICERRYLLPHRTATERTRLVGSPFSRACSCEEERLIAHQPLRKLGSLLGRPNNFFVTHQNSSKARSGLVFCLKTHVTGTVALTHLDTVGEHFLHAQFHTENAFGWCSP